MRVFVAGAGGTLGRRLVPRLVERGHEVVGTTRSPDKRRDIEALGAEAVLMDGLDAASVGEAIGRAEPEIVVHELTALAGMGDVRNFDREFAATNELRTRGTDNLLTAAAAVGVRRFVAQSYAGWPNERTGGPVKTEDDPLDANPPRNQRRSFEAIRHVERAATSAPLEGLVLRYGGFYGPGTSIADGGAHAELLRQRKFPIVGDGGGVWSFVHIDDAAEATALAVERGAPGIYNVVDDEPARVADFLPYLAQCVGAPPPRRVPVWLARLVAGEAGVSVMTQVRGSSNAKAKCELGWELRHPSWREGFREL